MRNYLIYPIFGMLLLSACVDQEVGQYPLDNVAPDNVKNVGVENLSGGAILSYDLPSDEDLLYVKVIYHLDNGEQVEQKSSAYTNTILIEGLGKSREQDVQILTGDRSKNESKPINVKIKPLDAPIYDVFSSIQMSNDFGGIRLVWENENKSDVVITVMRKDETNKFVEIDHIYTNAKNGISNVRGQESKDQEFAVFVRDRWQNRTETKVGRFFPLFEEELDKGKFARWNPPGLPYQDLGQGWILQNMWNKSLATPGFSTPTGMAKPMNITFDLGQTAKLSRFKIFQRSDAAQLYTGANVKRFEVWGSEHPNVNQDFSTWKKLGDFLSYKPSGLPLGQVSEEDMEYAGRKGEDYMVDLESPAIRYIRLVVHETWGSTTHTQIMEVSFFGQIQK
ncbi:DUF5000 domain-containing lipoprotein [Sphingobacterium humi]|nr:DUF5000 domain-containing lipoprotein [Sphingobacterium humi]